MSNPVSAPDITASSTVPSDKATPPEVWRCLNWLVSIIVVSMAMVYFLPALVRSDIHDSDTAQHVWWLNRFADPALFPGDPAAEFFSQPLIAPYGYQWLYKILVSWMDAQTAAEIVPFFLAPLVVILAYKLGRQVSGNRRAGGLCAVLFASAVQFVQLHGGLPRSFAVPILLLGMWALMARRCGWLGLSFVFAALLYPPIGINLGLVAVVVLAVRWWRERKLPAGWMWLPVWGTVALAIVLPVYATPPPEWTGPKTTAAQARTMAEFQWNGRTNFFLKYKMKFFIESERAGLGVNRHVFFTALVLLIGSAIWIRGIIPWEAHALLWTSLAAYGLAHLTLFALHVPNRYVRFSEGIFVLIWAAAFLPRAWERICVHLPWITRGNFSALRKLTVWLSALFVAGAGCYCYIVITAPGDDDLEAAYDCLRTLPKDTLVAAHPMDANDIPLRTRRSVLSSDESNLAYYLGYYRKMSERTAAEMTACFASDWSDVEPLHRRFGAKVFLVNRKRYRGKSYWDAYRPPFRQTALESIARGRQNGFILDHPPAENILFAQGDYLVVSLEAKN